MDKLGDIAEMLDGLAELGWEVIRTTRLDEKSCPLYFAIELSKDDDPCQAWAEIQDYVTCMEELGWSVDKVLQIDEAEYALYFLIEITWSLPSWGNVVI